MRDIDSLVPGFAAALERLPGSSEAYGNLMRSLEKGGLSMRNRAEIGLLVANRIGCDYCIWVMSRLAERRGLSGEDVLFAGMGIARGRRSAAVLRLVNKMVAGTQIARKIECDPADARLFNDTELAEIVAEVALAVLTCSILQSLSPRMARRQRSREA